MKLFLIIGFFVVVGVLVLKSLFIMSVPVLLFILMLLFVGIRIVKEKEAHEIYMNVMGMATNISDLDQMFYYAVKRWPQWKKKTSGVYKARRTWLYQNTPVYGN